MNIIKENEEAVSEIIGTLLLLSIVVGIFGMVYINIFSYEFPEQQPRTQLITTIQNEQLIIEISRGNDLSVDSTIHIDIDGIQHTYLAKDLMNNNAKADSKWSIGEQVTYNSGLDLSLTEIQAVIVDSTSTFAYHTGIIL